MVSKARCLVGHNTWWDLLLFVLVVGGDSDVMGRPNSGASLCSFAPGLSDRGNRKGAIGNSLMTDLRGESSSKVSAGRGRRNCKTY